MKRKTKTKRGIGAVLAVLMIAALGMGFPCQAQAAAGDPVLRFDLNSQDALNELSQGSRIAVTVNMSREDGASPYDLYAVQLDLVYDSSLFEVSELKSAPAERPDGESWIGSWSCNAIPGMGDAGQIRILYTNIGGLMTKPPKLDVVSAPVEAAGFVLTAKKEMPGTKSEIALAYTETTGSDWKISQSIKGNELKVTFAGESADAGGGDSDSEGGNNTSGGGTGGGGSGQTGGGSGSSGSAGDGSGSAGGGSGGSDAAGSGSGTEGSGSSASGAGSNSESAGDSSGVAGNGPEQSGSATKPTIRFSELVDVPENHWAADSIRYLVERGTVSGNEEKQFQPEKPVTRAEFCQMLYTAFGYELRNRQGRFADVTLEDWYFEPVMSLYEAGIAAGTGGGRFGAAETLSRQDMAQFISRVLADKKVELRPVREYQAFRDAAKIESYAEQAVRELYCAGIVSGTGEAEFSPEAQSTRAQAATVLRKLLKETEERR